MSTEFQMKQKYLYSLSAITLLGLSGLSNKITSFSQVVNADDSGISNYDAWHSHLASLGLTHNDDINLKNLTQSIILNKDPNSQITVRSLVNDNVGSVIRYKVTDPTDDFYGKDQASFRFKKGAYYKSYLQKGQDDVWFI